MKAVTVEVWSDFVCPWCWIAKRRLEQAIDSLKGEVEVTVENKAYRLAKGMPAKDYTSALEQKLGNAESVKRLMTMVGDVGASEGLVYNFPTMRFGDTSMAHSLIKSIGSPELAKKVLERIYRAGTTDGLDIFDRAVLNALALEEGFDASGIELETVDSSLAIAGDEAKANSIANGVPLFLFNNKIYVSGAREADVFRKALLDAATEKPVAMDLAQGQSCGIDGCDH